MEFQNTTAASQVSAPSVQQTAPPQAQADGQAPADAKATSTDPTPEVPLPIPASPSQTGLVSKASLPDDEAEPKFDTTGASAAQRTLKPYGIIMLPEKLETPQQGPLPDTSSE
ncbi:hypothetical protein SAMN05444287_0834 [Octadecabacter temperatus]|uniref:Uncharacterized protein n=1 Tax=Octadecabacter temperatus TaxID=1458307 RepID=A0A0K0Y4E8_9RHOB|nr:hypothetical protein [Octadecabacter temperatus]AKS45736.1 hypothetical protein OSB_11800 [Octadecabacter temperatus]SIN99391.1 hypothetical protein SAMN05444287_0834 [Octadecabacter temperatus]